ncbi:tripartite tricarboxylate transporter permease [Tissierella sp. Yu-01]|uniref:tripartite tricarboxylate transporter permease n=1 Tax=Tissierella sp. Yu-01 TaxID=3035694 RepID=UPI00240E2E0A|nr:tripartite tricarboxylate transporter permease [Tissierella sp. Yu-01]WFA08069.1 tripartite tricarboxylate transporter permease [Tissierella sp. Yu-01]
MLLDLATGFLTVIGDPICIALIFIGVVVGIIFGAVPGLTATTAIAMFLPITYSLSATVGISLLVALYIGGISGGLISAILLNMPGTPSSIATCFDGRPMALKGEAGKAIGVGIVFSAIGTILSIAALIFVAPQLAKLTIKFGPWEYFAVTLFSLTLIASLAGKSIIKGLIAGVLGMMFATIGLAPVDSVSRFTFGSIELSSGFDVLTVLVGLYAISEVINTAGSLGSNKNMEVNTNFKIKGFGFSLSEFKSQTINCLRSTLIGIGIGILPGIGGSTSNILAYSVAKNQSKYPEKFGTGIIDGVVASETANNATIGGAMIPLLTLGIPGDGVTAMLLGGFVLHGIQPGPLIFTNNASVVYGVFAAMVIATIAMLIFEFLGIRLFVKVLSVPKNILLPMIIILCSVGAFALNNRAFDILAVILFGIVGYLLNKFEYPLPPFILGFVLQETFEINLRRGLQYAQGNIFAIFNQPIAVVFVCGALISLILSIRKQLKINKAKAYQ